MLIRKQISAFVDWRSQISNADQAGGEDYARKALLTASYVCRKLSSTVKTMSEADLYDVSIKVYHGWHRGLTGTENFRGLSEILADRLVPLSIENVSFDWENPFGCNLRDAFDHRRHRRLKVHLPDTLREDPERPGREREKMVDTALVCDVLHSARTEPKTWRIIMAEDDDMIPAAFTAEKWAKEQGGKTIILRKRSEGKHINTCGILINIGDEA